MNLRQAKKVQSRIQTDRALCWNRRQWQTALQLVFRAHRRGSSRLVKYSKEPLSDLSEQMMFVIENGEARPARDIIEFGLFMERMDNRRVRSTHVGPVWVSTVFLAVNHNHFGGGPPVLWETMVFPPAEMPAIDAIDGYQMRYRSRQEAVQGHEAVVALVRAWLAARASA